MFRKWIHQHSVINWTWDMKEGEVSGLIPPQDRMYVVPCAMKFSSLLSLPGKILLPGQISV